MMFARSPGAQIESGRLENSPSGCKLSSLLTMFALSPGAHLPSGLLVNSPSG